jgi:hypothetical protein
MMNNVTDSAPDVEVPSDAKHYAIINIETGLVENISLWNGVDEWSPPEGYIAIKSDTAQIGWSYSAGVLTAPAIVPPTAAEILATNTRTRDALLAVATLAIAPLQDAVDLDDATADETSLLKLWKQYRVAVNRVDLTVASPTWPTQPSS